MKWASGLPTAARTRFARRRSLAATHSRPSIASLAQARCTPGDRSKSVAPARRRHWRAGARSRLGRRAQAQGQTAPRCRNRQSEAGGSTRGSLLPRTTTRRAGRDSSLAKEQSWRTASTLRSLLSWTTSASGATEHRLPLFVLCRALAGWHASQSRTVVRRAGATAPAANGSTSAVAEAPRPDPRPQQVHLLAMRAARPPRRPHHAGRMGRNRPPEQPAGPLRCVQPCQNQPLTSACSHPRDTAVDSCGFPLRGSPDRTGKGVTNVRKRIALLAAAMTLAASGVASAAITQGPGRGNPETNPSGKCPPGQNQETSPGGLKKCP
jgi:hypothetical protein